MTTVLGVDTAANSGWCIFHQDRYHSSGELRAMDARRVRQVVALAVALDPKCVLVLEKSFGGTLKTVSGLGAARGSWLASWQEINGLKTAARVKLVFPQTWRSSLLGSTAKTPLVEKLRAQLHAGRMTGPDESPAICIAEYYSKKTP